MQGDETLERHAVLMNRMATTLGVDLDEAELRGALAPEDRGDMLLSCTGCANPCGCEGWLDRTATATSAPDYCRNRDILADLRP